MISRVLALALAGILVGTLPAGAQSPPQSSPCGMRTSDWCPAPEGDPCGRHRDATACRADTSCYGMPYRGESVIACILDERGFASNCPTVGCTSTPPPRARR
jgi:hypothetical protein